MTLRVSAVCITALVLILSSAVSARLMKPIQIVETHSTNTQGAGMHYSKYNHQSSGTTPSPASPATPPVNPRACRPGSVLRVDFTASGDGDGRLYGNTYGTGILMVDAADIFEYEIMWNEPQSNCGVEFEIGASYRLRDDAPRDENGYSPHSERNANMTAVAYRQWYKRRWEIGSQAGKYIDKFVFSAFLKPGTKATAFFRYVRIVKRATDMNTGQPVFEPRRIVYEEGSEPPSVNVYFPGKIETSCQSEVIVNAESLDMPDSVFLGRAFILSGVLEASRLGNSDSAFNTTRHCPALDPREYFPVAKRERFAGLLVHNIFVLVRREDASCPPCPVLPRVGGYEQVGLQTRSPQSASSSPATAGNKLTLLAVSESLNVNAALPMPLYRVVQLPPPGALTHLLHGSVLEVVVDYSVLVGRTWINATTVAFSRKLPISPW